MTSTLSASAERQLERRAKHKLAVLRHVEEVSGSVAATCQYYGISRQVYYKWRRRYEDDGFAGLTDRSSAPHHSPNATDSEVIEKILWLRSSSTDAALAVREKMNPSNREVTFRGGEEAAKLRIIGLSDL